jgi:hypothetical protein
LSSPDANGQAVENRVILGEKEDGRALRCPSMGQQLKRFGTVQRKFSRKLSRLQN